MCKRQLKIKILNLYPTSVKYTNPRYKSVLLSVFIVFDRLPSYVSFISTITNNILIQFIVITLRE